MGRSCRAAAGAAPGVELALPLGRTFTGCLTTKPTHTFTWLVLPLGSAARDAEGEDEEGGRSEGARPGTCSPSEAAATHAAITLLLIAHNRSHLGCNFPPNDGKVGSCHLPGSGSRLIPPPPRWSWGLLLKMAQLLPCCSLPPPLPEFPLVPSATVSPSGRCS